VKPVIGISAYPRVVETSVGPTLLHTTSRFYVEGVERAGGVPVVLPVMSPDVVGDVMAAIQGVLLTGGGDVQPSRYGAKPVAETEGVDPARDDFDIALLGMAVAADLPVLATCRGMQVVNVALGGSLIQHVPAVTGQVHFRNDHWREGVHRVKIEPGRGPGSHRGRRELHPPPSRRRGRPRDTRRGLGRGRHHRSHRDAR